MGGAGPLFNLLFNFVETSRGGIITKAVATLEAGVFAFMPARWWEPQVGGVRSRTVMVVFAFFPQINRFPCGLFGELLSQSTLNKR